MQRRRFFQCCFASLAAWIWLLGHDTRAENSAPAPAADESWSVVYIKDQRIGYGRQRVVRDRRDGQLIITTHSEEHLTLSRFGQPIRVTTKSRYDETESGDLIAFSYEVANPPAQPTKSEGKVKGHRLEWDSTVSGMTRRHTLELEPGIKTQAFVERGLRLSPLKPGETRSFRAFLPEFGKVSDIHLAADTKRGTKLHGGKTAELLKVKISINLLPGVSLLSYVDDQGKTHKEETSLLGMSTYKVPSAVALEAIAGKELDVAVETLVRLGYPVGKLHQFKQAVLRLKARDATSEIIIPESATQSVKRTEPGVWEVTLKAKEFPKAGTALKTKVAHEFLAPSDYLQTKDARVIAHAERAAAGSIDPATIALRMEQYVYKELKKKNFSTALASAAEVAQTMEGDCTEHACLLAAMLRVKKIPSRVAVGYVYAEKLTSFGGHMWTEALIGNEWVALDATLAQGGIGVGHIKLGDTSLDDSTPAVVSVFLPLMNLTGNLQIDVLKVEP